VPSFVTAAAAPSQSDVMSCEIEVSGVEVRGHEDVFRGFTDALDSFDPAEIWDDSVDGHVVLVLDLEVARGSHASSCTRRDGGAGWQEGCAMRPSEGCQAGAPKIAARLVRRSGTMANQAQAPRRSRSAVRPG